MQKLPEYGVEIEWRYYNDGKAWLGKAVSKKKTALWLSVWEGYFKVIFHFTEKTRVGIQDLPISQEAKHQMITAEVRGRLVRLILEIHTQEDPEMLLF